MGSARELAKIRKGRLKWTKASREPVVITATNEGKGSRNEEIAERPRCPYSRSFRTIISSRPSRSKDKKKGSSDRHRESDIRSVRIDSARNPRASLSRFRAQARKWLLRTPQQACSKLGPSQKKRASYLSFLISI